MSEPCFVLDSGFRFWLWHLLHPSRQLPLGNVYNHSQNISGAHEPISFLDSDNEGLGTKEKKREQLQAALKILEEEEATHFHQCLLLFIIKRKHSSKAMLFYPSPARMMLRRNNWPSSIWRQVDDPSDCPGRGSDVSLPEINPTVTMIRLRKIPRALFWRKRIRANLCHVQATQAGIKT